MDFGGLIVSLKYLQLCFKDEWKFGTQRVEVNDDWFFFFCVCELSLQDIIYLSSYCTEPDYFLQWNAKENIFKMVHSALFRESIQWPGPLNIRKKKRSSMKIIPYDSCAI